MAKAASPNADRLRAMREANHARAQAEIAADAKTKPKPKKARKVKPA